MGIRGSLREASLPDVLQLLSMGQKTGCLSVTDRASFGSIFFERGRVIHADIVNRPDRLGALLVQNGLLDSAALDAAVEAQRANPGRHLDELLIEQGAIQPEQLQQFHRIQTEEAVYQLFTWTQGSFYFEADQRPDAGAALVSLNAENLLLEGARRVDEWELIENKIPSLDLIFALGEGGATETLDLTTEQRKLLPLLDGERSVQQLIDDSGLVQFDVGKALYGLIQAGVAHPVGRRPAEIRLDTATRVREYRNLGIAFYRAAMWDEATREFRRVAELDSHDPAAHFYQGLIGLRTGDDSLAMREFKAAAELSGPRAAVFGGLALSLERAGRLDDARAALEEALRLGQPRPTLLLSYAILLLKAGDLAGARAAFGRYRDVLAPGETPAAAFYAFAILAEAAAGRRDAATRLGDEGLAHHPRSAPLLLHLGAIRERRGEWNEAEALYRRALDENPDLPQPHRALGDVLYRRGAAAEAVTAFQQAIRLNPNLGDVVYVKLGNLHYKQAQPDEALRCWRRALQLNPDNQAARTNLRAVERVRQ